MSSHRRIQPAPAPWLRVLAVLCAVLVMTLSSATWSPALHAWLHGGSLGVEQACANDSPGNANVENDATEASEADAHDCAITLFANGVALANALFVALEHLADASNFIPAAQDRVALTSPEHLRPPPQAPPIG